MKMIKETIAAILSGLTLICSLPTQEGSMNGNIIPAELAYIPQGYERPAEHQGRLEKLTYDTWESFTYEEHSQRLTKEAWVYVPYGYDENEPCDIMYLSHGGGICPGVRARARRICSRWRTARLPATWPSGSGRGMNKTAGHPMSTPITACCFSGGRTNF